jgi:hypothetical protein
MNIKWCSKHQVVNVLACTHTFLPDLSITAAEWDEMAACQAQKHVITKRLAMLAKACQLQCTTGCYASSL